MATTTATETARRDSSTVPMTAAAGHHADNASSFDDGVAEKEQTVVLTKRQKVKRHCGRFKWWYLVAGIILLAIILPIIFKVIIPAIVKNVVDGQSLPVKNGTLRFVEPTRLYMAMDTSLDTPLGVKIDPLGLELYDTATDPDIGSPFLTLQMPEQHIHHETNVSIPDQLLDITDQTQLIAWFNQFFDQVEVDLRIKAEKLNAHLGSLDYEVGLDKTIKVQGLNYLHGFGVKDTQFIIPPGDDGVNMRGHLVIPNAGVLTLGMGNVSFNLMAGNDINLGLVRVDDLNLKPGNNTPEFYGEFYFDQLVPNLAAIMETQRDALNEGNIQLTAKGNSTLANGEHIKYIEGVLNNKNIPFTIPVMTLLVDVLSGVLAGGGEGSQSPLLDTLGQVIGNTTLFEQMLDHWEEVSGNGGQVNETASAGAVVKRAMGGTKKLGRTIRTNLFRLGLRSLRAKAQ
ncbi:hypothetical protein B0H66DRAFT_565916 [Apodospora peruviana]|uniref:Uncharacterized protein n=1 Tax=Apodospora peruviana TaxID=516989 RepID=A0AAE0HWP9_9PEZI|nr:hypothetical protein B0H66DRAFT_565916 [Apodospora peruviana]